MIQEYIYQRKVKLRPIKELFTQRVKSDADYWLVDYLNQWMNMNWENSQRGIINTASPKILLMNEPKYIYGGLNYQSFSTGNI